MKRLFGTFAGLLTVLFVLLKLTGVIQWSWLLVIMPLWIGFALTVVFWLLATVLGVSLFKSATKE